MFLGVPDTKIWWVPNATEDTVKLMVDSRDGEYIRHASCTEDEYNAHMIAAVRLNKK